MNTIFVPVATLGVMPHALFLMVTWTTHERLPMIGPAEAAFLRRFLGAEIQRRRLQLLALGLVANHLHLVLRTAPVIDIPRLVQRLKGASARIINQTVEGAGLRWAPGYTVQSVSPASLARAIQYVHTQEARHPDLVIPSASAGQSS